MNISDFAEELTHSRCPGCKKYGLPADRGVGGKHTVPVKCSYCGRRYRVISVLNIMVSILLALACAGIALIFECFVCKVPVWIPIIVSIIGYFLCVRIYPMEEEPEPEEEEPGFKEYDIDGVLVTVSCRDRSLAYFKDGGICSVAFSEINRNQYDKTLIGICEMLMHDGRLSAFEYIIEYIYKYDRDFAIPYISRYAVGEFTQEELLKSRKLKTDSIVKTAKMFAERQEEQ